MFRRISKLSFFLQFLIYLGLLALLWIPAMVNPAAISHLSSEGPLYSWIALLLTTHNYLSESLALILVIGLSLILYFIGTNNDILPRENFIPAIIYAFLLSWNPGLTLMNPILPAALLLSLSIATLMRLYGQPDPFRQVFMVAVYIGLASLFYLPSMYFMFMVWISLVTYRVTGWREWFIALIGFFGACSYIFLVGDVVRVKSKTAINE